MLGTRKNYLMIYAGVQFPLIVDSLANPSILPQWPAAEFECAPVYHELNCVPFVPASHNTATSDAQVLVVKRSYNLDENCNENKSYNQIK